jgi:hypothetical protein
VVVLEDGGRELVRAEAVGRLLRELGLRVGCLLCHASGQRYRLPGIEAYRASRAGCPPRSAPELRVKRAPLEGKDTTRTKNIETQRTNVKAGHYSSVLAAALEREERERGRGKLEVA